MANVIKKATNKFTKGLVMDFSPENTKNEVLTNALNATLLTFNGNELSLQNDMGNARVESAFLPEGYIPVGTCEYGGIIYIVSYNPLEDKSQIGCFPSPERNISREEMGRSDNISINYTDFQEINDDIVSGNLKNTTYKVVLRDSNLNPGDKFIVYSNDSIYEERIQDMFELNDGVFSQTPNPLVKISLVSIQDNGKIVYLNNDVRQYEVTKMGENNQEQKFKYHILGQVNVSGAANPIDVDTYRNVLSSGYNIFKEKTSGKLAILAELVTINTFSLTHSIIKENSDADYYNFSVILHPEVTPQVDSENYSYIPKLKYFEVTDVNKSISCIKDGTLQTIDYNDYNKNIYLFKHNTHPYIFSTSTEQNNINIYDLNWDFKNAGYHGSIGWPLYLEKGNYYSFRAGQLKNTKLESVPFYMLYGSEIGNRVDISELSDSYIGAILPEEDIYLYENDVKLDLTANYIENWGRPSSVPDRLQPIKVSGPSFLPESPDYKYKDIKFASFKLPKLLVDQGVNIPFKYDYSIVPCMEYGKLKHLKVSNTLDLNNLNNFNASKFTTWKYRIDGNQLTLTFGAEIFDTFEPHKVDGLFLEFYDWRGFAGSLEITGKKSYSGKFTKVISLNTLKAISNKKIEFVQDQEYGDFIDTWEHNVNIIGSAGAYKLNDKDVEKRDGYGWNYVEINGENKTYTSLGENNDCGTLYSNLIYMVKPYIRITEGDKQKFIEKDSLVLFTLPIYNDYYYTIDNFNTLEYPKLSLLLTYSIQDNSHLLPFNHTSSDGNSDVIDGYNKKDKLIVDEYKQGKYAEKVLELTRYFQYSGTSNLNLEVGLLKEYENCNLSCDKSINEHFKCTLELIDDNGKAGFQALQGDQEYNLPSLNTNQIVFDTGTSFFNIDNLSQYNFITKNAGDSININYQFLVDHKILINDIKPQYMPTTTICALFHKQNNGLYNYEDFGVYKKTLDNGNEVYLSDLIFYNSGDSELQRFGLCRMVDPHVATTYEQCSVYQEYSRQTIDIDTPGILNAGDPIKQYANLVGKLAFYSPHVSGLFSYSGVRITNVTGGDDDLKPWIVENARYAMVANTEQSLNNYSKFMVVNGATQQSEANGFKGFYASGLCKFNREVLDYMKHVYAYNPDYDTLQVLTGTAKAENKNLKIVSNLISKNSVIEGNFNDYVSLGGITISNYITALIEHVSTVKNSDGNIIPQLQFKADLTYCGTATNPYLVSQLSYVIEPSEEITKDLQLDLSNNVVVKHHDGSYNIMQGEINKKTLYGWLAKVGSITLAYPKLVQLDIGILTDDDFKPDFNYSYLTGNTSQEKLINVDLEDTSAASENRAYIYNLNQYFQPTVNDKEITTNFNYKFDNPGDSGIVWLFDQIEDGMCYDYYASWDYGLVNDFGETAQDFTLKGSLTTFDFSYNLALSDPTLTVDLQLAFLPFGVNNDTRYSINYIKLAGNRLTDMQNLVNELKDLGSATITKTFFGTGGGFRRITIDPTDSTFRKSSEFVMDFSNDRNCLINLKRDSVEFKLFNASDGLDTELVHGGLVLIKCLRNPKLSFKAYQRFDLAEDPSSVIHVPTTTGYGEFVEYAQGKGLYFYYLPSNIPTIGESTITINDLVYYPDSTGHRLFLRPKKYQPSGNMLVYRKQDEGNVGDTSKNTLRMFCGPGFNYRIPVNENDPEYNSNTV